MLSCLALLACLWHASKFARQHVVSSLLARPMWFIFHPHAHILHVHRIKPNAATSPFNAAAKKLWNEFVLILHKVHPLLPVVVEQMCKVRCRVATDHGGP